MIIHGTIGCILKGLAGRRQKLCFIQHGGEYAMPARKRSVVPAALWGAAVGAGLHGAAYLWGVWRWGADDGYWSLRGLFLGGLAGLALFAAAAALAMAGLVAGSARRAALMGWAGRVAAAGLTAALAGAAVWYAADSPWFP